MSTYQIMLAVSVAGVVGGLALAFVARQRPSARGFGTPAFLIVAVAGFALVLLLAGPIALGLLGLS